jgi:hypothetical protein
MYKTILVHKINKFYHIFWEVLDYDCELKVHSLGYNDLSDVLFDIHEILDGYDYDETDEMVVWLDKLYNQVINLRDKSPITLNTVLFNICHMQVNGFYEPRPCTAPVRKFAEWLYKKGVI